jgi:uncharacterized membrane protein
MRVVARSVVLGLGLAAEIDPPEKCFDLNRRGELPTCTYDGSSWEVTYPGSGLGLPGWLVFLLILVLLAGMALLIWKIALSRRLVRQAGQDEGRSVTERLAELQSLHDAGLISPEEYTLRRTVILGSL